MGYYLSTYRNTNWSNPFECASFWCGASLTVVITLTTNHKISQFLNYSKFSFSFSALQREVLAVLVERNGLTTQLQWNHRQRSHLPGRPHLQLQCQISRCHCLIVKDLIISPSCISFTKDIIFTVVTKDICVICKTNNRLMVAFDSNKGPNLKVVKWCLTSSQAPSYARRLQAETAPTYRLTDRDEV